MSDLNNQPRRSSRIKRKLEAVEAQVEADEIVPVPPPKRRKEKKTGTKQSVAKSAASKKAASSKAKEVEPESLYVPSRDTLFLGSNFETVLWTFPRRRMKGVADLEVELAAVGYDVHAYFASRKAATHAANRHYPTTMYRHIGSVELKKLQPDEEAMERIPSKSKNEDVNLLDVIRTCDGENKTLLDSLYSLSEKNQLPYKAPYIVLLANRKDLLNVAEKRGGGDLVAQVYVGRLLFELIALHDVKVVFDALKPSVGFRELPKMKEHPATLGRSPSPSTDDTYTLSGLLRRAESVGYASLAEEQRKKVESHLTVNLYPFQEETVRWMIDKENDKYCINEYFWEERSFTNSSGDGRKLNFYYFPKAGELRLSKPPAVRGGMVAEEMGLGKTVECLALIAAQKVPAKRDTIEIYCNEKPSNTTISKGKVIVGRLKLRNEDSMAKQDCLFNHGDELIGFKESEPYPKMVKLQRWTPQTTLVLCPKSLIAQWKSEAVMRAPSLTIIEWKAQTPKEPGTDCDLAVGPNAQDIVLATYEDLQKDARLSKICWKRLILDEAQVTRRSSTQIARDTFNLRADSRYLVSGTPVVTELGDLRGELAFLKVWPFTLFKDGFWEAQIEQPFMARTGTYLIDHLLSVTMMRHTKAQQLSLGLPTRSYETIEVELSGSHRAVYCFILALCLEELDLWSALHYSPRQLRALLRLLVAVCISPGLLNLSTLDLLRRNIWARRGFARAARNGQNPTLEKVTAVEAVRFLAETSARIARDSKRTRRAPLLSGLSDAELSRLLEIQERRIANSDSREIVVPDKTARVAAGILNNSLNETAVAQLHEAILELGLQASFSESDSVKIIAAVVIGLHSRGQGAGNSSIMHQAGFAALTRLIEKNESPSCPVCLSPSMDRISLTKCGHFYCVECLLLMCASSGSFVKCAICRREIRPGAAVEVIKPSDEKDCEEVQEPVDIAAEAKKEREASRQTMRFIAQSDSGRYRNALRPTTEEAWAEYKNIGAAQARFNYVGLNPSTPSLDAEFLRHFAAATAESAVSPKLFALRSLIYSHMDSKFCVVAETTESLRGICEWLTEQDITCTGVGSPGWSVSSGVIGSAAQEFATDPSIRVFLLNTANSAGLTLTAAQYVVFMEPMLRITDEMQAAARVHRIGQTRPVKIFRFVTKNTVEEQIMFRRGEIRTARQEADALLSVEGKETPIKDLIRLFRDLHDWEEGL